MLIVAQRTKAMGAAKMDSETLKKCPFCGTVPTLKRDGNGMKFRLAHVNQLCIFSTVSRAMSRSLLIRLWNKREPCGDCGGQPQMTTALISKAEKV